MLPDQLQLRDLRRFVPEEVLGASYGCGTPAGLTTVRPGETVLDIEAARLVGPSGRVIGVDMTPGVRVDVQTGGSSRGIADAKTGVADIGMSSRNLKPAR